MMIHITELKTFTVLKDVVINVLFNIACQKKKKKYRLTHISMIGESKEMFEDQLAFRC